MRDLTSKLTIPDFTPPDLIQEGLSASIKPILAGVAVVESNVDILGGQFETGNAWSVLNTGIKLPFVPPLEVPSFNPPSLGFPDFQHLLPPSLNLQLRHSRLPGIRLLLQIWLGKWIGITWFWAHFPLDLCKFWQVQCHFARIYLKRSRCLNTTSANVLMI